MFRPDKNGHAGRSGLAWLTLLSLISAGCSHTPSASDSLDEALKVNSQPRTSVAKFSGTVTVDGNPPAVDPRNLFYVFAYDPKHPPKGRHPPLSALCDKNGHFQFNTYGTGDGLPPGSYVMLFAHPKMVGGDGLKNLYNDPDQNAKDDRFRVELTAPGKTDWKFDLVVEGKDPVTAPGPNAVMADRQTKK
jgi:hypothetical protein